MSAPRTEPTAFPSTWRIYAVVVGVGVTCGSLILVVHEATSRRIEDHRDAYRTRAALDVLPGAEAVSEWRPEAERRRDDASGAVDSVLAGYDAEGTLVGVAIEATGRGYQDTIRLIYGYSPRERAILGFRILESRETPGLGDRVETDPAFVEQFRGLPVHPATDGSGLEHPIALVTAGRKRDPGESRKPGQIDGVTGATVTSRAVTEAIDTSIRRWLPRIESSLSERTREDR